MRIRRVKKIVGNLPDDLVGFVGFAGDQQLQVRIAESVDGCVGDYIWDTPSPRPVI